MKRKSLRGYIIFKPEYFSIHELVPEKTYSIQREERLWLLFDDRVLWTLQELRREYGSMIVNDWQWGGANQYGGWRPFDCGIGAELSQHKFGRAGDPKPQDVTAESIREDVRRFPDWTIFKYITCIENNVSWFHFDVRNYDKSRNGILFINP